MALDAVFSVRFVHRLRFAAGVFDPDNGTLLELLRRDDNGRARVLVFADQGLAQAQPTLAEKIVRYWQAHASAVEAAGPAQWVADGEAVKNEPRGIEPMLRAMDEAHLCRQSYVIAVGGGAVLDAVGFAAAMAHRGVRLIRVATTTLAQADSAMGVKNGINAFGKKNFLGTFAPPWAVINDESMLDSLAQRDWVSGFSEAVKVALLKDAALFERIERDAEAIAHRDMTAATAVIRQSARLHFEHITQSGDAFEMSEARPLDFGHWAAHRLESLTRYALPHGHAVACGMALDLTYAHLMGWMSTTDLSRVLECLRRLGFELNHPLFSQAEAILEGLEQFREHLGGRMSIPMVGTIGRAFDAHEIERGKMLEAMKTLAADERG